MSRALSEVAAAGGLPCGLAFQLGVVYRRADVMTERAMLWAKLLETKCKPAEVREGLQRLLADAMSLHAEVESAVKMAEELE